MQQKTNKSIFNRLVRCQEFKIISNPTRNSESARRNAPDSVHGGEIRDIKCKTGQPTLHDCPKLFKKAANVLPIEAGSSSQAGGLRAPDRELWVPLQERSEPLYPSPSCFCPGVWHFHAPGYGTLVGQNPDLGWTETKKAVRRL